MKMFRSLVPRLADIQWRNFLFFYGTSIACAIFIPWYIAVNGVPWPLVVMFLVGSAATCMTITAGYHRLLAHKSYSARPWVKNAFLFFGAGAYQASALWWASEHRRHHRCVDSESDPHNIHEGFFHAHLGWMLTKSGATGRHEFAPDLLEDKWVVLQDKYYLPLSVFVGFILPMLLGAAIGYPVGGLLFGGLLRIVVTNHSTFLINSLAHTWGTRPYNDKQTARDSLLMAFLAFGEGFHNYHHAFAADYRNGTRWYHWDPTKWLILSMSWMGWTYRLRTTHPTEILRARLANEQKRLVLYGMAPETVAALKTRVEEAQVRWRHLKEEYALKKREMRERSMERLARMKADIKVAKLEFRFALRQWQIYRRTLGGTSRLAGNFS